MSEQSSPPSPEQKAVRRAELIKLYRQTPAGSERDRLFWETTELQELYSAAMHGRPPQEQKPDSQ